MRTVGEPEEVRIPREEERQPVLPLEEPVPEPRPAEPEPAPA
ncbi:MAG TPA: hypothetical protein VOB72_01985 [Candidatus Dormibacteraeota bacterium]|nr:hypothetical protein [Candidatus Dormibacteraeota bacterium]